MTLKSRLWISCKRIGPVLQLLRHSLDSCTVRTKVVVEHLKEWKAIPRVGRLNLQQSVHVDSKQRPERLGVLHHNFTKPRRRL